MSAAKRMHFYLDNTFKDVRFRDARVLDVGSGEGTISCYAAMSGAAHVVGLEPEAAGSSDHVVQKARDLYTARGIADRVEVRSETFQRFQPGEPFDVVILHNSINHLDEKACIDLLRDERARDAYRDIFRKLALATRSGAQLVISDCARRNFFADAGLRNPFARSIEWHKHQQPAKWIALAREAGFTSPRVRWTPISRFGAAGRQLTGNALVSYLTVSHFTFTMTRS